MSTGVMSDSYICSAVRQSEHDNQALMTTSSSLDMMCMPIRLRASKDTGVAHLVRTCPPPPSPTSAAMAMTSTTVNLGERQTHRNLSLAVIGQDDHHASKNLERS